ncbi:MAG: DUF2868 domain-containing protein [Balneolaceae bacterium]|nr:MAG: DUF2868 domain-containing protein [Balneolaceae bacterium]
MTDSGRNTSPRLEVLIGLSLFDPGQVTREEVRAYRQFAMRQDSPGGVSPMRQDSPGGVSPMRQKSSGGISALPGRHPDARKIHDWYDAFMPAGIKKKASRIAALLSFATVVAGVLAFAAGAGAAGYFFRYDGTAPINVLPVLVIFALLPVVLLLFSVGYALWPRRGSGRIPMIFWWMQWALRPLFRKAGKEVPEGIRHDLSESWLVHSVPAGHYLRRNLQMAGIAYIIGALLWVLFHVTTTDLAFAWSSTLEMRGETLHAITRTISAPWRDLVPAAVVDAETVEATRFYRADGADGSDFRASASGRWWPFIFMSMMVYGFLPRLLASLCYHWRFRKTVDNAMVTSDSGREVLGFMEEALISVSSDDRNRAVAAAGPDAESPVRNQEKCVVLAWGFGDIDNTGVRNVLNREILSTASISGMHSLAEDRKSIAQTARASLENGHCDILVLVPLWEPPRLHFEKKLELLMQEAVKTRIVVIPVADKQDLQGETGHEEAGHGETGHGETGHGETGHGETDRGETGHVTWRKRIVEINLKLGGKRVFYDSRNVIESGALSGSK